MFIPFKHTDSTIFFVCIITGNCNSDDFKTEHRAEQGKTIFLRPNACLYFKS